MFIDFGEVFCIHTTFVKSIVGFFLTIFFQKFLDLNLDDIKVVTLERQGDADIQKIRI